MKISSKEFRVREGDEVNLKKWPTTVDPVYKSKEQYQDLLREHVAQLSSQQQLLYASNRYAVLLIIQAMDAAGKDGVIRHALADPETSEDRNLHQVQDECKDSCRGNCAGDHRSRQRRHGNSADGQYRGDQNIGCRRRGKPQAWARAPQMSALTNGIDGRLTSEYQTCKGEGS